ncbi:FAD-binding protein [Stenotrophomonas sp. MMGLT7]|uniref:FAD-binding protein n=1 Tax=Stenotrophomonas sp. MMGLT7 TaxID=2901227 RepID=UPI001E33261D|nr:FAD-binding protein [Stenotrophomonas sp. MMGLT7]MCD7097057.1 FAD-binding protein [Stenotrophomonas sp. MMGLT7]
MSTAAIDYAVALERLRAGTPALREESMPKQELLRQFHPDYGDQARVPLQIGVNAGDDCHPQLAQLLQRRPLIDDVDLAGATPLVTDVLVIGGGGAGCAAALEAAQAGASVFLANKLRVGDSNTVMAEGGIQAAVGDDDSLQQHYDDTLRGGHSVAARELVAQMVTDGPDTIRWLISQGMNFDLESTASANARLLRKRAGGTTVPRVLCHRDFTGLAMMRVLREAVELERRISVLNRCPAVELLSNPQGECVGAVLYDLERRRLTMVRAHAVVMATGGSGRLHLQGFATSNHYGATADGLVMAYRMGARLRDLDSFQYHPTGIAAPLHLAGSLVSEAVRSAGTFLVNGLGERFIDELQPRDVVAAAILRECAQGRGIVSGGGVGVFLDTPGLIAREPEILGRLISLSHIAHKCGIDPAREPLLVHPTLHYQNGGVVIDADCATTVPGLYCAGEVSGGIHGRNRLMGNALLDIICFGRRAGAAAASRQGRVWQGRGGIEHVHDWQRALMRAGLDAAPRAPMLYPDYGHFDLHQHRAATENSHA